MDIEKAVQEMLQISALVASPISPLNSELDSFFEAPISTPPLLSLPFQSSSSSSSATTQNPNSPVAFRSSIPSNHTPKIVHTIENRQRLVDDQTDVDLDLDDLPFHPLFDEYPENGQSPDSGEQQRLANTASRLQNHINENVTTTQNSSRGKPKHRSAVATSNVLHAQYMDISRQLIKETTLTKSQVSRIIALLQSEIMRFKASCCVEVNEPQKAREGYEQTASMLSHIITNSFSDPHSNSSLLAICHLSLGAVCLRRFDMTRGHTVSRLSGLCDGPYAEGLGNMQAELELVCRGMDHIAMAHNSIATSSDSALTRLAESPALTTSPAQALVLCDSLLSCLDHLTHKPNQIS